MESGLQTLERAEPNGMTRLDFGIREVNRQINRIGENRFSVLILLTDGRLNPEVKEMSVRRVNSSLGIL